MCDIVDHLAPFKQSKVGRDAFSDTRPMPNGRRSTTRPPTGSGTATSSASSRLHRIPSARCEHLEHCVGRQAALQPITVGDFVCKARDQFVCGCGHVVQSSE